MRIYYLEGVILYGVCMRVLSLIGACSLFSACTVGPDVSIKEVPASYRSTIQNNMSADDYPSFMAGAGNIYTCRYGINFLASDKFTPPKEHVFAAYLTKHRPDVNLSQVKLKRFDLYHNQRLELLDKAGSSVIGGAVGAAISANALSHQTGFSDKKLRLYDLTQSGYTVAGENAVGCDGRREGEYYASRVTGGSNVIVSWFDFEYAGKQHSYRTTFEFQNEGSGIMNEYVQEAVATAMESSIRGFANRL